MGTRLNCLAEVGLTSTHNLYFEQKYEKYQSFLSETIQFLEVKFSVYLNRHVFLMDKYTMNFQRQMKIIKLLLFPQKLCLVGGWGGGRGYTVFTLFVHMFIRPLHFGPGGSI